MAELVWSKESTSEGRFQLLLSEPHNGLFFCTVLLPPSAPKVTGNLTTTYLDGSLKTFSAESENEAVKQCEDWIGFNFKCNAEANRFKPRKKTK